MSPHLKSSRGAIGYMGSAGTSLGKEMVIKKIAWEEHGFINLLVWLLLYLIVSPFLESLPYAAVVINVFLTAVMFSAAYAMFTQKTIRILSMILLSFSVIILWAQTFGFLDLPLNLSAAALLLYFSVLVYAFSRTLLATTRVTANVVSTALCLYMILALWWGAAYALLDSLQPGSFSGTLVIRAGLPSEKVHFLTYFSFVTLTTLGYGDITPQTRGACGLCQAEAMIGQFFIAVLVARLVSVQASQKRD